MSMPETTSDFAAEDAGLSLYLSNGNGYAWNETIEGIVTVFPHPTQHVTFSVITVSVVEQDVDGFTSPVGFAGIRDPLTPFGGIGTGAELGPIAAAPIETSFGETVIARDVSLTPGTEGKEIPFTFPVPDNISLSAVCHVAARAMATDGVDTDRHSAVPFVLLPPRYIQAVQNALKTIGDFERVAIESAPGVNGSLHSFTLDYTSPKSLQDRLDGIKFELAASDIEVSGIAEINPQEKTIADHLRAFLHADRLRIPVTFDRAELESAGQANAPSRAVQERLHELLDPFLNPVVS